MPRRKLTEDEKARMQAARVKAREEKQQALDAVENNSQFANPKFWKNVDSGTIAAIEKAMEQAKKAVKSARIVKLEEELAQLKGE